MVIKKSLATTLLDSYDRCYVSCRHSHLSKGFFRPKFPSQGLLASAQALGRVLYHFTLEFGPLECVIEGFDLYLSEKPYSNQNYHKQSRQPDGNIDEIDFTMALSEHDYIYNFLFLKEIINKVLLKDSAEFSQIIELDWQTYCRKLHAVRDFKTLRNI